MKLQVKTILLAILAGYFAIAGAVIADNDILHKKIEIRAADGDVVVVKVDTNDALQVIELDQSDLGDENMLLAKLADLDDEAQEMVMQALQGVSHMVDGSMDFSHFHHVGNEKHKVVVVNDGEGTVVHKSGDMDFSFDFDGEDGERKVRKQILIGKDAHSIIKGHSDVIVRLIENGEFSQEELDKIQAALDAKR